MRIAIDGYNLAMPNGTGIATYGFVLANTLKAAGHEIVGVFGVDVGKSVETRETLFFDRLAQDPGRPRSKAEIKRERRQVDRASLWPFGSRRPMQVPLTEKVEKSSFRDRIPQFDALYTYPNLFRVAERHFSLYGKFLSIELDDPPQVMHWTYPVPVRMVSSKNIYTLHDMVPLKLPYTTLDVKQNYRKLVAACAAQSDRICTVSNASAADIQSELGIPSSRITNTYQASPLPREITETSVEEDADAIEGVFGLLRDRYFLFFGALEPKKNVGRLIEAYLSIRSEHPLVLVGARAWRNHEELKLLPPDDGSSQAKRIIQLDYLPRTLLLKLIRGARGVAFPSLYEGFGLPVLEAMQLGAPVLTSNVSSLPEVAMDAAVYVDPYDVGSIQAALRRLDTDGALRDQLRREGVKRAANFAPARYMERLDRLYPAVITS